MPSERVQRQIDRLLDEAEAALGTGDWSVVRLRAEAVLRLDGENSDARTYLAAAGHDSATNTNPLPPEPVEQTSGVAPQPTSFANGRYVVSKFLGEGGKKKVYLAKDTRLDRDVAFALIKTEGLDEASRVRVQREAEAMGRLGAHPHIVTVFDIGEEDGQPYLVLPVLAGGDVEGVIEKAPENKLTIERAVKIAIDTCLGLEFAHAKGIVHRDLKPGNVWLTEDGRAMIGDFGLAVAVDKSRLTQAGMMVGTVSYMPPEQAMGGDVGPRSDLYSLGAMLYEMICGRPPFVGDESVAIIGQHLNTPPVAPSWHRPDCPPALEALILRLLEKDPTKRPASATEVREALSSVTAPASPRLPTVALEPPAGDNPLYRRTFVGRENEVRQLQQAFDAALSGQGGLVMVVGEPGIGKTALCEQLATYVALRGGKALVGHCYEEGSLSLPYLAFVEAMRSYVLAREPDGLRSDLGTGAAEVARIVSEVRDRVTGIELRLAGDPEDDRWRLLQAITSLLRNASTVQPLCIVLEDLHWADRGTLDLLLHVSRNLSGTRLLVVGTYRDVEVERGHPLSNTLADLRREANFARVPLRGLTVDEVHRMYEANRGQEVSWGQAEAVHRQTEGNPLFVQEVLRYLVEEGFVVREEGRYVTPVVGVGIPEGLRDVIGRRLSHLDERTNTVLTVASVVGRDFRLEVLQGVVALSEEELYAALEQATQRAIVEQVSSPAGVGFRYTHAMFRTLLYDEIFAPRRIRLHQQVGRVLEAVYARRLEEHASELAEHFSQSTETADLEKAVRYGELAAVRASSVFAYSEAVRHLEQALRAQEVLAPDDSQKRCDLLISLAEAQMPVGEPQRVISAIAEEAFKLAESLSDQQRMARICQLALTALGRMYPINVSSAMPIARPWLERSDSVAVPGTSLRALADVWLAGSRVRRGDVEADLAKMRNAVALAGSLDDPDIYFNAVGALLVATMGPAHWRQCSELAEAVLAVPRVGASARMLGLALQFAGVARLAAGDTVAFHKAADDLADLAGRSHDTNVLVTSAHVEITRLTLQGRIDDAIDLAQRAIGLAREGSVYWHIAMVLAAVGGGYLGKGQAVLDSQPDPLDQVPVIAATAAHDRVRLENLAEAKDYLMQFFANYGGARADLVRSAGGIAMVSMAVGAVTFEDRELARLHLDLPQTNLSGPIGLSMGRLIGACACMLGEAASARERTEQAIAYTSHISHRPELALSRLQMAEILLEHFPDEHDAAIEHLDFAIAELRDMKMQPALERALRHRGLLKA